MRRRTAAFGAGLGPTLLLPRAAAGHASERMVILTLPTGHYIAGAALAVALTAAAGLLAPRLPVWPARQIADRRRWLPEGLPSWAGCAALLALAAAGLFGSRDPLGNPLTLGFWTLLWVGFSLVCMLAGDLWRPVNPWTGPARSLRRWLGWQGQIGLAGLGLWPAVLGYLLFAWFEIVSLRPDDPAVLARVLLVYWAVILVLAVLEGEAWIQRGEAFSVFFGLIGTIAPLWSVARGERVGHFAGAPGTQILAMPALPPSGPAFVTLVLASVSFDGLAQTFWWLSRLGINPLEFPGRSAVTGTNSLGLLIAWAATAGLILGAIGLGRRLSRRSVPFWQDAGPWLLSFLPIAAGYHAAHYLVALLTDGQYAVVALGDPLGRGWNLFGLPHHWVSFGFLQERTGVLAIWNAQFAMILGAHLLAVLLSLRLAGGAPARAHLPMTMLMVLYTILGLWLLSAPTAG